MTTLIQSWRESLELYKPSNLTTFGLLLLKTMTYGYTILFSNPIVLIAPLIITIVGYNVSDAHVAGICYLLALGLLYEVTFLALRPSIVPKDIQYFKNYKLFSLGNALVFFSCIVFFALYGSASIPYILAALTSPLLLCSYFFFLDSYATGLDCIRSVRQAVTMVLYLAPLYIPLWAIFYAWAFCIYYLALVAPYNVYCVFFVLVPLTLNLVITMIACVANVYSKNLRSHFNLYHQS